MLGSRFMKKKQNENYDTRDMDVQVPYWSKYISMLNIKVTDRTVNAELRILLPVSQLWGPLSDALWM